MINPIEGGWGHALLIEKIQLGQLNLLLRARAGLQFCCMFAAWRKFVCGKRIYSTGLIVWRLI